MEIMQSEFFCILQQEASNLSKMRILSDAFTVKNRACKGPQLGPCYLINSHDLLRRHVSSLVRKLPTNFFVYKFQRSMNIFMRAQKMVCFEGYTEFLVVVEAVFFSSFCRENHKKIWVYFTWENDVASYQCIGSLFWGKHIFKKRSWKFILKRWGCAYSFTYSVPNLVMRFLNQASNKGKILWFSMLFF